MNVLENFLQKFFDSFPTIRPPALPIEWFWPMMAICALVIMWMSYLLVKTHEWKRGQAQFAIPPQLKLPAAKKRTAVIIDFASAGQRVRNQKLLLNPGLVDRATLDEVRAVRGTERDSFDFSNLQKTPEGDDDGPQAA